MESLTSNSLRMMERSMDFLWAKQAAHLDNISNAETPNYKTKTVTFEQTFTKKLEEASKTLHPKASLRGAIEAADWTVREDGDSTRMDDNGVNVTEQGLEAVRTAYQLQYVMQSISSDLTTLGKAISGS